MNVLSILQTVHCFIEVFMFVAQPLSVQYNTISYTFNQRVLKSKADEFLIWGGSHK